MQRRTLLATTLGALVASALAPATAHAQTLVMWGPEQITEPLDPADLPEGDVSDAGAGAADAREDASPAADPHDRDLPDRR